MRNELTEKDQDVYEFIVNYMQYIGYPPTIREICDGVDLYSTASVIPHLQRLESDGWIKVKPNSPRAIRVMDLKFVRKESRKFVVSR